MFAAFIILCLLLMLVTGMSLVERNDRLKRLQTLTTRYSKALDERNAQQRTIDQLVQEANELTQQATVRNQLLDFVLTTFSLHLPDPYVQRPTFEEKRCVHCMYPDYAGHDANCSWVVLRPYTKVLYPTPQSPVASEPEVVNTEAQVMLPAEPEQDIEVPDAVKDALK